MATVGVAKGDKGAATMKKGAHGVEVAAPQGAVLTSAQGLISLMEEDDDRLRAYALRQLNVVVSDLWFEVSAAIATIEALYEDESFSERNLAALLASKVSERPRKGGGRTPLLSPFRSARIGERSTRKREPGFPPRAPFSFHS